MAQTEPKPPFTVKLTYFKATGKYYAEGQYQSEKGPLFEIVDEVRAKAKARDLPGLRRGSYGWTILVNVPDHPHDHPRLIMAEPGETPEEGEPCRHCNGYGCLQEKDGIQYCGKTGYAYDRSLGRIVDITV